MFKAFRLTAAAAVTAAVLISGCSLAPDYERPSMPEGAFWSGDAAAGIPDWQKQFTGAELSRLIDQALKTNRDLKLAILNVAAYEAKYRITRADLLPSLNGAAGSTRSKVSDSQSNMTNSYSTQYNVGLNVGWELDFFGKIRNQKEAAVEQYLAEQENRKSAQMSI
ncbi:MAG: TolC family protein, partial [Succinivibrionaceae bacterium]|nr:TolC family protein [Succinivibrionaceae bacterium]